MKFTMEDNPIQASLKALVDSGWTEEQAKNLMRALKCDSPERLWELAPQWIQHCIDIRQNMTLLECVALGPVRVDHSGDDWTYALDIAERDRFDVTSKLQGISKARKRS